MFAEGEKILKSRSSFDCVAEKFKLSAKKVKTVKKRRRQTKTERSYQKHKKLCPVCKLYFSRSYFPKHLDLHENQTFSCTRYGACEKVFRTSEALANHVNIFHKKIIYSCEVCHRSFTNKTLHYRHKKSGKNLSIPHRCPRCCHRFKSTFELEKHIENPCGGQLSTEVDNCAVEMEGIRSAQSKVQKEDRPSPTKTPKPSRTRSTKNSTKNVRQTVSERKRKQASMMPDDRDDVTITLDDHDSTQKKLSRQDQAMLRKVIIEHENDSDEEQDNDKDVDSNQEEGSNHDDNFNDEEGDKVGNTENNQGEDNSFEIGISIEEKIHSPGSKGSQGLLKPPTLKISGSADKSIKASPYAPFKSPAITDPSPLVAKVSFTENDSLRQMYLKSSSTGSAEEERNCVDKLMFLYKIWGLITEKVGCEYSTFAVLGSEGYQVLEYVNNFFRGKMDTTDAIGLHKFLGSKPEEIFGRFIVGVLLVQFCWNSEKDVWYKFFKLHGTQQSKQYLDLITEITTFVVYDAYKCGTPTQSAPEGVRLALLFFPYKDEATKTSLLVRIYDRLLRFMRDDLQTGNGKCVERQIQGTSKVEKVWTWIASFATNNRFVGSSLTDELIKHDLEYHINTVPYFTLLDEKNESEQVHLHKEIVEFHGVSSAPPGVTFHVRAKNEDRKLLVSILYRDILPSDKKKAVNITAGICKLVEAIGIHDPWKLMFKDEAFKIIWNSLKKPEKIAVLVLAVQMSKADFIAQLAQEIFAFLNDRNMSKLLFRQMSDADFNFLLSTLKSLPLSTMDMYMNCLYWAHEACNLTFDEDNVVYYPEVAEKLSLIESLIDINAMDLPSLQQIGPHGYISLDKLLGQMEKLV